jgi:hypothetical protein
MKKVFIIIVCITTFIILTYGLAFADVYHARVDFTIPAASNNSPQYDWVPAFNIPSGKLYVNAYANLANPTGTTESFTIKPHSTASNVGWMPIDGALYTKSSSMAATGGTTYKARAYKLSPSLSIKVTGKAYFHSKNNS